jgi:Rad52/22 family double-strand break repair protein
MNRALLEKPFEPAQIRQRKGRNGVLDYVEGHSVIARLNAALDCAWSFEITHHEIREDEVLVIGRLAAEGVTKMAFGTSQVTREKGTGQVVSLGDDLKAAATDALKKCATFLGVGLHLYADKPLAGRGTVMLAGAPARPPGPPGTPPTRSASSAPTPRPSSNVHDGAPFGGAGVRPAQRRDEAPSAGNGVAASNGRITDRQLDAIVRIAHAKGLKPADIDGMSLRAFGRKAAELGRGDASSLIKELTNMKRPEAS